jgi:hypothetical protein
MLFENWGATTDEIDGSVFGDGICANARTIGTRSISIDAPPEVVFPWIRQMGFGRAGWYSYDWMDNLCRRSATEIHPEWQLVQAGAKEDRCRSLRRSSTSRTPSFFNSVDRVAGCASLLPTTCVHRDQVLDWSQGCACASAFQVDCSRSACFSVLAMGSWCSDNCVC